jgi:hypothetical protein
MLLRRALHKDTRKYLLPNAPSWQSAAGPALASSLSGAPAEIVSHPSQLRQGGTAARSFH